MSCWLSNKINSGSFGDVYKINCEVSKESASLSKESYAIKIIKNSIYGIRCFTEIIILLFLKYSYIMNCYQFQIDTDKNVTKILMPLATCDLKSKLLKKIQPKDLSSKTLRLKTVLWQIVCGVGFLHSKGIVHGDIKPSNILLHKNEVKLTDFSLSSFQFDQEKIYKDSYTEAYRAPEIWNKKGYSYKADIWALGCTFHEIVYNKRYFPESVSKELLGSLDVEFYNLLNNMLKLIENDRFDIWEVMKSDYFKDNYKEFKDFELKYPKRLCINEEEFTNKFQDLLNKYVPEIPRYVYEIIAMKIFRKDIDKRYNIYLDSTYILYENKILETLNLEKIGLEILNF